MERILHKILSGITIYDNHIEKLYIKTPSLLDSYIIIQKYEDAYNEAYLEGLLTEEEITDYMIVNGFWNKNKEDKLSNMPKELEDLKVAYYEAYCNLKVRKYFPQVIQSKIAEFSSLLSQKHAYDEYTCSGYANLIKSLYIIGCSTYTVDGRRRWPDTQFLNVDYHYLINIIRYYMQNRISDTTIRQISKLSSWKNLWNINKDISFIFNVKNSAELNDEQRTLITWTQLYDNLNNLQDCPDQEVISDDDMLDGWLIKRNRDQKTQSKSTITVNSNHNEVFVVTENEDDINRVNNLNTPEAKFKKHNRFSLIQKHGQIKEQDFPDSRLEILKQSQLQLQGDRL